MELTLGNVRSLLMQLEDSHHLRLSHADSVTALRQLEAALKQPRSKLADAAPDLLEALKNAEQFIANGFEFGIIPTPIVGDAAHKTLPLIRAAIAKAEAS